MYTACRQPKTAAVDGLSLSVQFRSIFILIYMSLGQCRCWSTYLVFCTETLIGRTSVIGSTGSTHGMIKEIEGGNHMTRMIRTHLCRHIVGNCKHISSVMRAFSTFSKTQLSIQTPSGHKERQWRFQQDQDSQVATRHVIYLSCRLPKHIVESVIAAKSTLQAEQP